MGWVNRRFFHVLNPWSALAESLALLALLLLGLWALTPPLPSRLLLEGCFYSDAVCALWCAVRLRMAETRRKRLQTDLIVGLFFGSVVLFASLYFLIAIEQRASQLTGYVPTALIFRLMAAVAGAGAFMIVRSAIYLWRFWNRLRRQHLLWSLVHGHMLVVLMVFSAVIAFSAYQVVRTASYSRLIDAQLRVLTLSRLAQLVIGVLLILTVMSVFALFAVSSVLLPSAAFSFLVMRTTMKRLRLLTEATRAFRSGKYSARVVVGGEDEVAALQTDFNAMSAGLEKAVIDLRIERDTVQHLLDARRAMAANVSHELRTPVATLRAALESAVEHDSTLTADNLQAMVGDVIRLQALIDDLFLLSSAEVGQLTLRCQSTDAGALVRRLVASTAALAWRTSRVEVIAATLPNLPLVQADPGRLEQILRNLIHNAVRHTPSGGVVTISAAAEIAETVALEVWDTGEGIPPDEMAHIFERFYRGETSRLADGYGLGLGLALVKELSEAMGGSVSVESTPGQGSRFVIHLRRAAVE